MKQPAASKASIIARTRFRDPPYRQGPGARGGGHRQPVIRHSGQGTVREIDIEAAQDPRHSQQNYESQEDKGGALDGEQDAAHAGSHGAAESIGCDDTRKGILGGVVVRPLTFVEDDPKRAYEVTHRKDQDRWTTCGLILEKMDSTATMMVG